MGCDHIGHRQKPYRPRGNSISATDHNGLSHIGHKTRVYYTQLLVYYMPTSQAECNLQ